MPRTQHPEQRLAEIAARAGAKAALEFYPKKLDYLTKPDTTFVTEADFASERAIIRTIRKKFPTDRIISEESGIIGKDPRSTWIIDPIDGTANFIHKVPFFCMSVAFYKDDHPVAAAVYAPMQDEMFSTYKGGRSTLNGEHIHTSSARHLKDAYIDLYWERKSRTSILTGSRLAKEISIAGGRVRNFGSSALSICSVACGRSDAHIHTHILLHDVAAASLILKNAGGRISDFCGKGSGTRDGPIIASNGKLHKQLLPLFKH